MLEVVAPRRGRFTDSRGAAHEADHQFGGGPSVLFDAVAVLVPGAQVGAVAAHPAARDFVTDAHTHAKVIGYLDAAHPLFEAVGLADRMDDGYVALKGNGPAAFLERCRAGRVWSREAVPAPV